MRNLHCRWCGGKIMIKFLIGIILMPFALIAAAITVALAKGIKK